MKECTIVIPVRDGTYGLAIKYDDIHTKNKNFDGTKMKWNGWGGKKEWYDFFIIVTAIREFWQESGAFCFPWNLRLAARINFHWPGDEPGKPTMHAYVYFADSWVGTIRSLEKGEMGEPVFFTPAEIPYDNMMKGDRKFLPRLIKGERFVANIYFDQKDEDGLPTMEIIRNFVSLPWLDSCRMALALLRQKLF